MRRTKRIGIGLKFEYCQEYLQILLFTFSTTCARFCAHDTWLVGHLSSFSHIVTELQRRASWSCQPWHYLVKLSYLVYYILSSSLTNTTLTLVYIYIYIYIYIYMCVCVCVCVCVDYLKLPKTRSLNFFLFLSLLFLSFSVFLIFSSAFAERKIKKKKKKNSRRQGKNCQESTGKLHHILNVLYVLNKGAIIINFVLYLVETHILCSCNVFTSYSVYESFNISKDINPYRKTKPRPVDGDKEYVDCVPCRGDLPIKGRSGYNTIQYMITRFQFLRFGECGALLYCHYSLIHSDLEC